MSAPTTHAIESKPALSLVKSPPTDTAEDEASSTRAERQRLRRLRAVLAHDRTREAWRLTVRHSAYIGGGARILAARAWEDRTTSRYQRMFRAALVGGNVEEAKDWEERGHRFREARHKRRMDLISGMKDAPKALGSAALAGTALLAGTGVALALADKDPHAFVLPFQLTLDVIEWAFLIGTVVWGMAPMVIPALGLLALWNVGRQRQAAPRWALPAKYRDEGGPITPSIVVKAFRDLGIATLRKGIEGMDDAGAGMLSPISMAGCGVEVAVLLPSGVSTEEIQKKRRKLAENLGRHEHEVYISIAPQPRTVKLWIADSGALDEPVPASPLVTDPSITANYKTGRAPWGVNLRGDAALLSLYQKMILITGLSNQGKTAALRALALWLIFDPRVDFRIADLKGIGDWAMFDGLATTLIQGPTDEHVIHATEMVEGALDEMNRRIQAPPGTEFPPLICIVDEAQVAYGSGAREEYIDDKGNVKYGAPYGGSKNTSRYFRAVKGIHDQGRAVNVLIWEGTQDPTNENLPKRSREGNHIRASLVLGTASQAGMALGDAPVAKGAAPHTLRLGLDKGQLVVAGEGLKMADGQVFENVRTHYIDDNEAAEIAERAKKLRNGATSLRSVEPVEERDELADLAAVVGDEKRVRTPEVLHRLKNLDAAFYGDWSGATLRGLLIRAGEDTDTYTGYPVVTRERVLKAIGSRDQAAPEGR